MTPRTAALPGDELVTDATIDRLAALAVAGNAQADAALPRAIATQAAQKEAAQRKAAKAKELEAARQVAIQEAAQQALRDQLQDLDTRERADALAIQTTWDRSGMVDTRTLSHLRGVIHQSTHVRHDLTKKPASGDRDGRVAEWLSWRLASAGLAAGDGLTERKRQTLPELLGHGAPRAPRTAA